MFAFIYNVYVYTCVITCVHMSMRFYNMCIFQLRRQGFRATVEWTLVNDNAQVRYRYYRYTCMCIVYFIYMCMYMYIQYL